MFDLPTESLGYFVLYLVTLVLHVVVMNYVVAGALMVAGAAVYRLFGEYCQATRTMVSVVKDWLPLALGVTITLGVAPILFVQLLYKHAFYTANLLLFHRWMAILPVLIVAFYLLYLQKTKWLEARGKGLQALVAVGVLAMFLFVAWSWSENHLLSLAGQETWTEQFAAGRWWHQTAELPPRLSLWMIGSLATFAVLLGWQLMDTADKQTVGRLSLTALSGAGGAVLAAIWYAVVLPESVTKALQQPWPLALLVVGGVGLAGFVASWGMIAKSGQLQTKWMISASASIGLAIIAATLLREVRRYVALVGVEQWDAAVRDTQQAAHTQGLGVFLLFFVGNAVVIAGIIWNVRKRLMQSENQTS
ncbi:hypothetical protein [Aeoliella mucimassa]|uniref:Uncharacterized protein n=1 Tax=Aeoliella mucimassa TaxID=2527972 RepID=A0A518AQV8_9BACT|nr:hypothetical protein [Aeoliella mucimassa]QDU57107.1 hypothetical protein Pan181_33210 [Aeoliella mucimassa]